MLGCKELSREKFREVKQSTLDMYSVQNKISINIFSLIFRQVGSPTALANLDVENRLRWKASTGSHGIYIPSGSLWGGADIKKMADIGTLKVCVYKMYYCL